MKVKPLIIGISGTSITDEEYELLQNYPVFGFILFSRNIQSSEQLLSLTSSLKNIYASNNSTNNAYQPLIVTDQEGGKVARLKPPIASKTYSSAEYFAEIYIKEGSKKATELVKQNYHEMMLELNKYGVNSPLAPVVDLSYPFAHQVIGNRSFGSEVKQVVELCSSAIEGIVSNSNGNIAAVKHAPGHGRSKCDSHEMLPRVTTSLEDLNKTDFEVFRQLGQKYHENPNVWAMTAHIIFDCLDPILPVTLSAKAINFIRRDIGFKGTIITDDIGMQALHTGIDINNKEQISENLVSIATQSLQAGCNLILHCSGNIAETKAICEALPSIEPNNITANNSSQAANYYSKPLEELYKESNSETTFKQDILKTLFIGFLQYTVCSNLGLEMSTEIGAEIMSYIAGNSSIFEINYT